MNKLLFSILSIAFIASCASPRYEDQWLLPQGISPSVPLTQVEYRCGQEAGQAGRAAGDQAREFHEEGASDDPTLKLIRSSTLNQLVGRAASQANRERFEYCMREQGYQQARVCISNCNSDSSRATTNSGPINQQILSDANNNLSTQSSSRAADIVNGLGQLEEMFNEGLLSEQEYNAARRRLLGLE